MSHADLSQTVDAAWEDRANVGASTTGSVREAVETALRLLDSGEARVAEKSGGEWRVHQWLKKAVLLSFRLNDMTVIPGGPGGSGWWGKGPSQFEGRGEKRFRAAGIPAGPNCAGRPGPPISPGAVVLPSFR